MGYDEMIEIQFKFLDTIDIRKFIIADKEIELCSLMQIIQDHFDNNPGLLPGEFHGFVFNFINDDEFREYLEKRYGWKTRTEVVVRNYVIPRE